jgi:hypothetical protein
VFYMMFGLNTVLVKTMPSEVDYITGTEFSFEQPKHFKFNDIRQPKASLGYLGSIRSICETQGLRKGAL